LKGELLGTYGSVTNNAGFSFLPGSTNIWFGGKLIWGHVGPVYQDRLGTQRYDSTSSFTTGTVSRFYPYGEEITSTSNDKLKFGTYTRDSYTGLDYADQRFYASSYGRFNTPDPYGASAGPSDPSSWNRYSYTSGDPVNRSDPEGLEDDGGSDGCYYNGMWVSGCDLPIGIQRFAPITAFGRATQRLGAAVDALEDRNNVSANCQKDLDALSQSSGQDISLGAIQNALANTDFKNGTTSNLPVSSLFGPGAEAAGAAFQRQEDGLYGPGQTIANEFGRNPAGLTANTVLNGSTIFINPTLIGGNLTGNQSLMSHEALHELGMVDTDIQAALGITVDGKNTRNITTKLQKDCITGKGNN
jgi:RHS repeat-associated protein